MRRWRPPGSRSAAGPAGDRDPSRTAEAETGENTLARGRQDEIDEGLRRPAVVSGLQHRDRVGGHHVLVVGDHDPLHLDSAGLDVGDVHDAGIGFPQGNLADDCLDIGLLAGGLEADARPLQDLERIPPARHGRGAQDDHQAGATQVRQPSDSLRVAGRDHDLQPVGGEHPRGSHNEPGVNQLLHVGLVRRRKHVGGRTLLDLGGQRGRAGQVELRPKPRIRAANRPSDGLERRREGGGRENGDRAGLFPSPLGRGRGGARAARRRQEANGGDDAAAPELYEGRHPALPGSSTTTLVALIAATTRTPGARPSSSAASRVMRETTRWGPAWISTWAVTRSLITRVTIPGKWLRADWPTMTSGLCASGTATAKRASSAPSISRCRPAERTVWSRPLSVSRRTLSMLSPSSSAAWPIR